MAYWSSCSVALGACVSALTFLFLCLSLTLPLSLSLSYAQELFFDPAHSDTSYPTLSPTCPFSFSVMLCLSPRPYGGLSHVLPASTHTPWEESLLPPRVGGEECGSLPTALPLRKCRVWCLHTRQQQLWPWSYCPLMRAHTRGHCVWPLDGRCIMHAYGGGETPAGSRCWPHLLLVNGLPYKRVSVEAPHWHCSLCPWMHHSAQALRDLNKPWSHSLACLLRMTCCSSVLWL